MDRNGLRPMRYTITGDGRLIAGSEAGMVRVEEARVVEKGRLGPGQMIAIDLREGRLYHDREIKDHLAGQRPFGAWVERIKELDELIIGRDKEPSLFETGVLRRLQVGVGVTMEDLELILHPRSEEPTSLQSLMRLSYAVFC